MNTISPLRQQRNLIIYRRFLQLRDTTRAMDSYALLGNEFYMSEESIRKIIKKMHTLVKNTNNSSISAVPLHRQIKEAPPLLPTQS